MDAKRNISAWVPWTPHESKLVKLKANNKMNKTNTKKNRK